LFIPAAGLMSFQNKTISRTYKKLHNVMRDPKRALFVVAVLFLISLFLISTALQKTLFFIALCAVSGVMVYINYILKIPLDFTPVFFFSIIMTKTLGLWPVIIFIFLGGVLPTLIAGGRIDSAYLVFLVFLFLSVLLSLFLSGNIVFVGIILSVFYFVGGGILSTLTGEPAFKQTVSILFGLCINIFYFLKFGHALIGLMN
jgi:hypothetical protein